MHNDLAPTFRKHMFKLCESGQAVVFPMSELTAQYLDEVGRIHSSVAHWVQKAPVHKNPPGRFCIDASNRLESFPLNSEAAKELLSESYGALKHPTIV
jgi:hypothetical protein